jgi:hypothetical protein
MSDLLGSVLGMIAIIGFVMVIVLFAGDDDDDEMWGGE